MLKKHSRLSAGFLLIMMLCVINSIQAQDTTNNYLYDSAGRLKAVTYPNGQATIYEYDVAGNLIGIRRETNLATSIINFTPKTGAFNSLITIFGTGFSSNISQNNVSFNGSTALVTAASESQLTVRVPNGATTGKIQVTSPNGTAQSSENFTVAARAQITNISPFIGRKGDSTAIEGLNFDSDEANDLWFNNLAPAIISSTTATRILTKVPDSATSGRVTLSNPAGTAVSEQDFFVVPNQFNTSDINSTNRLLYGETKTISFYRKLAMLVFDGTAGQKVGLQITVGTNAAGALNPNLVVSILGPDGAIVVPPTGLTTQANGVVVAPFILPATGTYTILLDKSLYPTTSGNVQVQLLYAPENATQTIQTNGSTTNVSVNTSGQNVPIGFNGIAGQRVRLNVSNVSILSGSVTLLTPAGVSLFTVPLNLRGTLIDIGSIPLSGKYIVIIQTIMNEPGNASLSASIVPTDATIPISQNAQSVTTVVTATGQNPQLTFNGTFGQRVNLEVTRASNLTGDITIKNPDGTTLKGTTPNSKFSFSSGYTQPTSSYNTLLMSGTHAVSVATTFYNSAGNATFSLSNALPDANYQINFPGSARIPGNSVLTPNRNIAIAFDGVAGRKASVKISLPQNTYTDFDTYIYAPDGTVLWNGIVDREFIDGIILPLTGKYIILLDPFDGYYVDVNVSLFDCTDLTGTIGVNGAPITVTPGGNPTSTYGDSSVPGQDARLIFNGIAGQRVYLTGDRTSIYGEANISLLNPDGSRLGDYFSIGFDRYSRTGNTNILTLPQTGTYTVLVDPPYHRGLTARLSLSDVSQSGSITVGGPSIPVNIAVAGQNSFLNFTGTAGQHVKLDVSNVTPVRSRITIYKPDGTIFKGFPDGRPIGNDYIGTNGGTIDVPLLPVDGTYTIIVNPDSDYTGSMTLALSRVNDIAGSIVVGGAAIPINVAIPRQNAKITFAATKGQNIKIALSNSTIYSGYIYIYKPDGTPFYRDSYDYSDVFWDWNGTLLPYLPETGVYTILIDPGETSIGTATLTVTQLAGITKSINVDNSSVNLNVTTAGASPQLTFSANKGQHLRLRTILPASNSSFNSYISIYNSNGERIPTSNKYYDLNDFVTDVPLIPATGVYTIVIDMGQRTGNVTCTLRAVASETIAIDGPERVINLTAAWQSARFAFNGVQGQRIAVGLRETFSQGVFVSVINSNGIVIKEPVQVYERYNSGEVLGNIALPAADTYYIVITTKNRNETGTVAARIYDTPEVTAAITIGTPILINVKPGQNYRLTFNATAGQRVTVVINSLPRSNMKLSAPDGKAVTGIIYYNASGYIIVPAQTLPVTGAYTIELNSNDAIFGSMNVIVTNP